MGIGYRDHYAVETQSNRDNYNTKIDEDGKLARDLSDLPGGEHLWRDVYNAPEVLKTSVQPLDKLLKHVQSILKATDNSADVRLSTDAGDFLCGFVFYTGLVERWRLSEDQNVIFLHLKPDVDEAIMQEGKEVAMAVIRAAVSLVEERRLKKGDEKVEEDGCCVVG
jgi:pyroglutamyl-peptidase